MLSSLAAAGDAADAPERPYVAGRGFHLHSDLKSIRVDSAKKRATCVASVTATVFTEEVVTQTQPCEFLVKVGGTHKFIVVGVTSKTPNGHSCHLLGESGFRGSFGAAMSNMGGIIMHGGKAAGITPSLAEGDVVGLRVREGRIYMIKNGSAFMDFQSTGPFRFAVSLHEPGQTASIVDPSDQGIPATPITLYMGELKPGGLVNLPRSTDERLKSMRVHWNDSMLSHCGQLGKVLEVGKRSAKVSVGGDPFHWDLEVFDAQQKRFCYAGCDLFVCRVGCSGTTCDVCGARNPMGSQTARCENHNYDMCEYCTGKPTLPAAGNKVIRGPTWKWGCQDGEAYAEGTVLPESADRDGWFTVKWGGRKNVYRGPPFQDVVPAHENGLKGSAPPPEVSLQSKL